MTGIVLWDDNEKNRTDAIQLEYSYVGYDQVVSEKGVYDWQTVDDKLTAIAARGHQAVLRFYFDYVGKPTTVPAYIKQLSDYSEITAKSEGKMTGFCDWSLKHLLPGEQRPFTIAASADASNFQIACDRLVEGQLIPFTSK